VKVPLWRSRAARALLLASPRHRAALEMSCRDGSVEVTPEAVTPLLACDGNDRMATSTGSEIMVESQDRRYVVLLIGTFAGPGPATELLRLSQRQPSFFHLVVPATVPQYGWTWTQGQALADAQERIQIMTEFGSAMSLDVRAEVLPTDDPVEAVRRVVGNSSRPFDELIVIDRAKGVRRWLEDRVLDELRRDPGLPLIRFETDPPLRPGGGVRRGRAPAAVPGVPQPNGHGSIDERQDHRLTSGGAATIELSRPNSTSSAQFAITVRCLASEIWLRGEPSTWPWPV
jgi:hypothetical protein